MQDTTQWPGVQELAQWYIAAVRSQQPRGPYCLAGISLGGILAYEIAQQLRAQGEEVAIVAMFDSILPRGLRRDRAGWVTGHLRKLVKEGPGYLRARLGGQNEPPSAGSEEDVLRLANLRERIYLRAIESYDNIVKPYAGTTILFRAKDQSGFVGYEVDDSCGWGGLVEKHLKVYGIEGDHLGILTQPSVDDVARILRGYLDRVSPKPANMATVHGLASARLRATAAKP